MGLVYDIVNRKVLVEEAKAFAKRFVNAPTKAIGLAKLSSTNLSIMTTKLF